MVVHTVVLCDQYVGAQLQLFELIPLLKVVLKKNVASTVIISCVARLKLGLSTLLQVILHRLCVKVETAQ
jgi:hypothetical protein